MFERIVLVSTCTSTDLRRTVGTGRLRPRGEFSVSGFVFPYLGGREPLDRIGQIQYMHDLLTRSRPS